MMHIFQELLYVWHTSKLSGFWFLQKEHKYFRAKGHKEAFSFQFHHPYCFNINIKADSTRFPV
jgi:hypothetical protein